MPEKIGERRSTGSHCGAPVANTSLVVTTVKPSHSNSCYSTSAQGLTDTSSQQDGTPLKDQAKDGGMSVFREFYQTKGINTARSALSSFVQLDDGSSIGKNPLISRLLKGVFQSRAPKPKYREVWDVQIVLSYLKTLHPVDSLSL